MEFDFPSTVLAEALSAVPGMSIAIEELDGSSTVPLRNMFLASGGDFDAFEAAMREDPTVRNPRPLSTTEHGRLYSVEYPPDLPDVDAYRAAVELDAVVLSARSDGDGYTVRMRFPGRDAVAAFRERCAAAGLALSVRATFDRDGVVAEQSVGLTEAQHEALRAATDLGYFSIPRDVTLDELGAELGVSRQAASERLRRGMDALVSHTLDDGLDGGPP